MSARLGRQTVRNQRACIGCRQLRCDGAQNFPAACSRCKKNKIQCRIDQDYKRIRTKDRLEEVTTQLNAIQASLGARETIVNSSNHSILIPQQCMSGLQPTPPTANHRHEVEDATSNFYRLDDLPDQVYLGQVFLDKAQTKALFEHFAANYYRHCPILDTEVSIEKIYRSSPILFWTIITISARWHPSLNSIYALILDTYRVLLGTTLLEPIHSLESVQALALRCFWPLAVTIQVDDPSWNYCGLLANSAIKMGLHKIQSSSSGLSQRTASLRRIAWMACVHANCTNSWNCGVAVAAEVVTGLSVPPSPTRVEMEFVLKVHILRRCAISTSSIAHLRDGMNSWTYLESLCNDIYSVRDDNEKFWTSEMDVIAFGAQLFLCMLQLEREARFQITSKAMDDQEAASAHMRFINFAYMTATQLIKSFSTILEISGSRSSDSNIDAKVPQRHLPKHYFGLLLLALAFMFKVKILHVHELSASRDHVETQIRAVYDILSSWSRGDLDEAGRGVRLITVLTRNEKVIEMKLKESSSEGRPGLTVLDNLISSAKSIREKAERAAEVSSDAGNQMADDALGVDANLDLLGPWQDSLSDWSFPWGLDLSSIDQ